MSIEFAVAAAANAQPANSGRRLTRDFVPATASKPEANRANRFANFTDCVEFAFGGLVLAGTLFFAAALLRYSWINGLTAGAGLHVAARIVDAAAGATFCAVLYSLGRGIFRLVRN